MHPIFKKSQKIRKEKESENIESGEKEWHSLRGRRLKGKGTGNFRHGRHETPTPSLPFQTPATQVRNCKAKREKKNKNKTNGCTLGFYI